MAMRAAAWPALSYDNWADSCATLHLWTQIVGKIRMAQMPAANHWWHVPLYLTARGLTTAPMPHGGRIFQIDFDFVDHQLRIDASDGRRASLALQPRSVAAFYGEVMGRLRGLGLDVKIWPVPVEIADPIPFERDDVHAAYDPDHVNRFWQALAQIDQVFREFRGRFLGKVSPVHFFWGSFDLAVTRFSGRPAPPPPGNKLIPDRVNREAYSHEVSSCGFWPGNGGFGDASFYCYAYPQPAGFAEAPVTAAGAAYSRDLGEFLLPYEAVRRAAAPRQLLLDFLQETYAAAADLGGWDRTALERPAA
jgi:hypothetical protein